MHLRILVLMMMIVPLFNVQAASFPCKGKIQMLFVARNGEVQLHSPELYGNNTGRALCNIKTDRKGITPDICKTWYAQLLAASSLKTEARLYYEDNEVADCQSVQAYSDAEAPWGVADRLFTEQ